MSDEAKADLAILVSIGLPALSFGAWLVFLWFRAWGSY